VAKKRGKVCRTSRWAVRSTSPGFPRLTGLMVRDSRFAAPHDEGSKPSTRRIFVCSGRTITAAAAVQIIFGAK